MKFITLLNDKKRSRLVVEAKDQKSAFLFVNKHFNGRVKFFPAISEEQVRNELIRRRIKF